MSIQFTEATMNRFKETVAKYPHKEAAIMPTLWMAQEEFGYLSTEAMAYVAKLLDLPPSKVYSVASFYTMYKKKPTGKYLLQVCRTLSCQLRGAEEVTEHISQKLGIKKGETSNDQKYTLIEVECLGSCGTAPMMQVNNDYFENLTRSKIDQIIDSFE